MRYWQTVFKTHHFWCSFTKCLGFSQSREQHFHPFCLSYFQKLKFVIFQVDRTNEFSSDLKGSSFSSSNIFNLFNLFGCFRWQTAHENNRTLKHFLSPFFFKSLFIRSEFSIAEKRETNCTKFQSIYRSS